MSDPVIIPLDDIWAVLNRGGFPIEDSRFLCTLRNRAAGRETDIQATLEEAARCIRIRRDSGPKPNGPAAEPEHADVDLDQLVIDRTAPYATAKLFRETRYSADAQPTLHHHRGGFYCWSGAAYLELSEAALRSNLYEFIDHCVASDPKNPDAAAKPVKPTPARVS